MKDGQEGQQGQEGQEGAIEITQEILAEQYNSGKLGDLAPENNAGAEGAAGDIVTLSADETAAYGDYLGADIPETMFKNEEGKAYSRKEVISNLNKAVAANSVKQYSEDAFINDYVTAKNAEGFDQEAYVKSLNAHNAYDKMSSDEINTKYYESKGYKPEDIKEELARMSNIQKDEQANNIRAQIKTNESQRRQQEINNNASSRMQSLDVENARTAAEIDKYASETLASNFPIKFTPEQAKKNIEGMKSLMSHTITKDESGNYVERHGLDAFMKDDAKLLKALPYLEMIENNTIDEFMANHSKSIKDREFDKLDGGNNLGQGGSKRGVDREKLYAK